jgi:23S rRNA pseudouridine2605 synthase
VFEHLPEGLPRVISVGRLDLSSEGLLLLTNDGDLTRALELPSNGWVRRYRARAYGRITQDKLDKLKDGITVEGVHYGPIEARLDKVQDRSGDDGRGPANLWISISLTEGKNREVRRVLEHLGVKVNRLIRLAYGPFALGTLAIGEVEEVGPRVIREQLAEQIPPERMPKGDRRVALPTSAAAVAPGRPGTLPPKPRPAAGAPRRGARATARETGEAPEKKVYKPGWAKPKRKPSAAPKSAAGKSPAGRPSAGKPPRRPRPPKGS